MHGCVSTKPQPKNEFLRNGFPWESVLKTIKWNVIGMSIFYTALTEGQRCSVNLQVALPERNFMCRVLKHIFGVRRDRHALRAQYRLSESDYFMVVTAGAGQNNQKE
jgi:hypothetical protein